MAAIMQEIEWEQYDPVGTIQIMRGYVNIFPSYSSSSLPSTCCFSPSLSSVIH